MSQSCVTELHRCGAGIEDEALSAKLFGPVESGGLPLVEEARGGTLCLEDIEAMSPVLQGRLLTFINDQPAPPHTRIVAICNDHKPGRTLEDVLRPDLYYRLAAMKLTLPPLRTRGEDILALFKSYATDYAEEYGCPAPDLSAQDAAYRASVLGEAPRVSMEAAATFGWSEWLGDDGRALGLTTFGTSAPYEDAYAHFGLTAEKLAEAAQAAIASRG